MRERSTHSSATSGCRAITSVERAVTGLTPRHRESDTTVHRGPITKQGSALVRWAAIEAVQRIPASAGWLVATRARSPNAGAATSPPSRSPAGC